MTLAPTPVIVTCPALRREVEAIVRHRHWDMPIETIEPVPRQGSPRTGRTITGVVARLRAEHRPVVLVSGDCGGSTHGMEAQPGVIRLPGTHEAQLLLGQELYSELHHDGVFFLLPEWAVCWREMFVDPLDPGDGRIWERLSQRHRRLVYIDTGLMAVPGLELAAFASFAKLPWETIRTGLGVLEASLENALRGLGIPTTASLPGMDHHHPDMEARILEDANEERYRMMFTHAPDAIILTDEERMIDCNPAGCALLGCDRKQVLGRSPMDFAPVRQPDGGDSRETIRCLWNSAVGGEPVRRAFWRIQRVDGTPVDTEVSVSCITIAGRVLMMVTMRDITQRLNIEQQRFQAAKEDAIGRLAGGVAHDFNNILAAIVGYAELLANQTPADAPQMVRVHRIIDAACRGTALTQQLLAFARRQVIQPRRVDLSAVVQQTSSMLPMLLGDHIALRLDLADDLPEVLVDPTQIGQVVMNLAAHARDAMPDGGTLLLSTRRVDVMANDIEGVPGLSPGPYITLSITDDGDGIPSSIIGRIFEPFFTTKESGKGTGLGLAMCHGIIRQNHGHIAVTSKQGRGTTFRIHLPAAVIGPSAIPTLKTESGDVTGGTETILLVEDDDHVRAMAEEYLGMLGYQVLVAVDGIEALALVEGNGGDIDAVLTDVMMPRMGGRELVRRLSADYPHIRSLMISGYGEDTATYHGIDPPGVVSLPKPFTLATLAVAMRHLLESDLPEPTGPFVA